MHELVNVATDHVDAWYKHEKKKNYIALRIKWPYLPTDGKQTYIILSHAWNVWGTNFQENPSNGTRYAIEILLCSPC